MEGRGDRGRGKPLHSRDKHFLAQALGVNVSCDISAQTSKIQTSTGKKYPVNIVPMIILPIIVITIHYCMVTKCQEIAARFTYIIAFSFHKTL
jgi:hypothetical protein